MNRNTPLQGTEYIITSIVKLFDFKCIRISSTRIIGEVEGCMTIFFSDLLAVLVSFCTALFAFNIK